VLLALPDSGGSAVVVADEPALRQVVSNLVSNAMRHTPDSATVTIRVRLDGSSGVLDVADDGPGMTQEHAVRVFERFYRVDQSRTRGEGGGSGLGLSIVASLVAAQGGQVTLTTAPGQGATFGVALPLWSTSTLPVAALADAATPESAARPR
jgi:two-component system OmpR family sensor kinase